MAVSQAASSTLLKICLFLLGAFGIISAGLQAESLSAGEGYALYVVRDEGRIAEGGLRASVRYAFDNLNTALTRAAPQPPLYFLLLDGWTILAGESIYVVRLLSAWGSMVTLAATCALVRRWFNLRAALLAVVLLGTAGMMVHYGREAQGYSLLLMFTALATLLYWRWWRNAHLRVSLVYGIVLVMLFYTHYAAILVFLAHVVHALVTAPRRVWHLMLPGGIALLVFASWLWWVSVPLTSISYGPPLTALVLWALYLLLIAGILIILRRVFVRRQLIKYALPGLIVILHFITYPHLWPPEPPLNETFAQFVGTRDPLEPVLTNLPEASPAAYYDRQLGVSRGLALDLAWRGQGPHDMASYAARLKAVDSVWIVMPGTLTSTWDAAYNLLAERHVGYRDGVSPLVIYRFDAGAGQGLQFRFGDVLAHEGNIYQQLSASAGETLCLALDFRALAAVGGYAAEFVLLEGGEVHPLATLALENAETFTPEPCFTLPTGTYHLGMRLYGQGQVVPVLEGDGIHWGDTLILALLEVS